MAWIRFGGRGGAPCGALAAAASTYANAIQRPRGSSLLLPPGAWRAEAPQYLAQTAARCSGRREPSPPYRGVPLDRKTIAIVARTGRSPGAAQCNKGYLELRTSKEPGGGPKFQTTKSHRKRDWKTDPRFYSTGANQRTGRALAAAALRAAGGLFFPAPCGWGRTQAHSRLHICWLVESKQKGQKEYSFGACERPLGGGCGGRASAGRRKKRRARQALPKKQSQVQRCAPAAPQSSEATNNYVHSTRGRVWPCGAAARFAAAACARFLRRSGAPQHTPGTEKLPGARPIRGRRAHSPHQSHTARPKDFA